MAPYQRRQRQAPQAPLEPTMHQCFLYYHQSVDPEADEESIPDVVLAAKVRDYAAAWIDLFRMTPGSATRVQDWDDNYGHVFDPKWRPDDSWRWWLQSEMPNVVEAFQESMAQQRGYQQQPSNQQPPPGQGAPNPYYDPQRMVAPAPPPPYYSPPYGIPQAPPTGYDPRYIAPAPGYAPPQPPQAPPYLYQPHVVPAPGYAPPPAPYYGQPQQQAPMPDIRAQVMQQGGHVVPTMPNGQYYRMPPVDPQFYQHGEGMLGDPNFRIG